MREFFGEGRETGAAVLRDRGTGGDTAPEDGREKTGTLRNGYTTGSCAAAATRAAAEKLLSGRDCTHVTISLPGGGSWTTEVLPVDEDFTHVSCAVRKYSGDDPDVTNGTLIVSTVSLSSEPGVRIDGGRGVGRVTRPGLDQPIGAAAINSVPRRMIRAEAEEVLLARPEIAGLDVIISIPEGEELASKTFNPKLGIVGGISVLGTTGIVKPMSDEALLATIRTEISVRAAEHRSVLIAVPGNYGQSFLSEVCGFSEDEPVTASNFMEATAVMAAEAGFKKLFFAGHIGKLIKAAGGIANTHSKYGDRRMEILADLSAICLKRQEAGRPAGCSYADTAGAGLRGVKEAAARASASGEAAENERLIQELQNCVMTDEAVRILRERGLAEAVFAEAARRCKYWFEHWSGDRLRAEVLIFSSKYGELARTKGADELLAEAAAKRQA